MSQTMADFIVGTFVAYPTPNIKETLNLFNNNNFTFTREIYDVKSSRSWLSKDPERIDYRGTVWHFAAGVLMFGDIQQYDGFIAGWNYVGNKFSPSSDNVYGVNYDYLSVNDDGKLVLKLKYPLFDEHSQPTDANTTLIKQ